MKKITSILIILFSINVIFANNSMLPNVKLKDFSKKKIKMNTLAKDGPILINFWTLACEPCKKEMKYLEQFHQKYSKDGFKVVSVNTDNSRNFNRVRPFIDSQKYTFTVLNDPNYKFFRKLGGQQCPYLVLFDEIGNVVAKHSGYNPGDEIKLEQEIINIIAKASNKEIEIIQMDSTKKHIEVKVDSLKLKDCPNPSDLNSE